MKHTGTLPTPVTTFIGREAELADAADLLCRSRLLTVAGPGGCGKTRLALRLAGDALDAYEDGVVFCDLAVIADAALVGDALATNLGIRGEPGVAMGDTLIAHLAARRVLLVLDNCEHLVDAVADIVDPLLLACPSLTVLATSREPLSIDGEVVWRVPSMSVPDVNTKDLEDADSVLLFVDRARRAKPSFELTDANGPAIAEICQRLDGIPLSIELAAARMRVLTPDQIRAGLNDRFRLLGAGSRRALARQRTLSASVDWSHSLLNESEQALFRRLSVFVGGFSIESAEEVCNGDAILREDVLDLICRLVDRSLVQAEQDSDRTRYRMLETLRHYGADRLIDAGEGVAVRTRHLSYFAAQFAAIRASPKVDQYPKLVRIASDEDNIRAAIDWALDGDRLDLAEVFLPSVAAYWWIHGRFEEGTRWLRQLLGHRVPPSSHLRMLACHALAWLATFAGDDAEVEEAGSEGLSLARAEGDQELQAACLTLLVPIRARADTAAATALAGEAVALARETDNEWVLAAALHNAGVLAGGTGGPARDLLEEAVATADRSGFPVYTLLASLGSHLVQLGDLGAADRSLREAVRNADEVGDRYWGSVARYHLAALVSLQGDLDEARALFTRSQELADAIGAQFWSRWAKGGLATVDLLAGDTASARRALASEVSWMRTIGAASWLPTRLATLAEAHRAEGDLATTRRLLEEASAVAQDTDDRGARAAVSWCWGLMAREEGSAEEAASRLHDALKMWADLGQTTQIPRALDAIAGLAVTTGRCADAVRIFGASSALMRQMGLGRPPYREAGYLSDRAAALSALGEEQFAVMFAEGEAMSMEQAIVYARRGRGDRRRPQVGWASLTPTEVDVANVVAEGVSNSDAAKRLYMSTSTVRTHLSHIFAKLDLRTRGELAAFVARRQS